MHVASREAVLLWGTLLGPVAWRVLEVLAATGIEEVSVDDLCVLVGAGATTEHVHVALAGLAARGILHADLHGWAVLHPLPAPSDAACSELPDWLAAGAAAEPPVHKPRFV